MPVLSKLADNKELNLPYLPLVWTLAFGTCLGGKYSMDSYIDRIGQPIGSS